MKGTIIAIAIVALSTSLFVSFGDSNDGNNKSLPMESQPGNSTARMPTTAYPGIGTTRELSINSKKIRQELDDIVSKQQLQVDKLIVVADNDEYPQVRRLAVKYLAELARMGNSDASRYLVKNANQVLPAAIDPLKDLYPCANAIAAMGYRGLQIILDNIDQKLDDEVLDGLSLVIERIFRDNNLADKFLSGMIVDYHSSGQKIKKKNCQIMQKFLEKRNHLPPDKLILPPDPETAPSSEPAK